MTLFVLQSQEQLEELTNKMETLQSTIKKLEMENDKVASSLSLAAWSPKEDGKEEHMNLMSSFRNFPDLFYLKKNRVQTGQEN